MIRNALHIINDYKPAPADALDIDLGGKLEKYTDYTRYFVGKRYLDLIAASGPALTNEMRDRPEYWRKGTPVHDDKFDITYTKSIERLVISEAYADGRAFYGDRFDKMFMRELLQGLLTSGQILVCMSPGMGQVNQVSITFKGVNIWGERVYGSDRVFAGIGLGAQAILVGVDAYLRFSSTFDELMATRHWNAGKSGTSILGFDPRRIKPPGAGQSYAHPLPPARGVFFQWPGEADFEPAIETARPLNSRGTMLQVDPRMCGHMVAEGAFVDLGVIPKTRPEAELLLNSIEAGAQDILAPEIGMWPTELAAWAEHHGLEAKFLNNPSLRQVQLEMDQGGKVLQVVNWAPPGEAPGLHWVRNEGLDCNLSPNRIYVSVGDPFLGMSQRVRSYLYARRLFNGGSGFPTQPGWTVVLKIPKRL
jgi:hypothetical protein